MLFPPYDFAGTVLSGDSVIIMFKNSGGTVFIGQPFPLFAETEWFSRSALMSGLGILVGDTYKIEVPTENFAVGINDIEAILASYIAELSSLFSECEGTYEEVVIRTPSDWFNYPDLKDLMQANADTIYALFSEINSQLGFEFVKEYGDPATMFVTGLLFPPYGEERAWTLQGDNSTFPHSISGTANDDGGFVATVPKMEKFGYKYLGAVTEDGTVTPVGSSFTVDKDGEILTPVFEQLTGKAHGGVLLVKFQ